MSESWWLEQPAAELEQGDVLQDVVFVATRSPTVYIKPKVLKGGVSGWEETSTPTLHPAEKKRCVVAYETIANGIVISHGCDIDKPKNDGRSTANQRILVAPILPLSTLPKDQHAEVLAQRRLSQMPLPAIPEIGDWYVDLRLISPIPRALVDSCKRISSMTAEARFRLQAQIEGFLFRTALPPLTKAQ